MAKNLTYNRKVVENLTIKGIMNADSSAIVYIDEDKNEQTITIKELLSRFCAQAVSLSVKIQSEEELDIESDEDNDFYEDSEDGRCDDEDDYKLSYTE